MSEASFYNSIRDGLNNVLLDKGEGMDIMRVENMVQDGPPDVNFCYSGVEGWIELKFIDSIPKRDTSKVFGSKGLRPSQIIWIHRRVKRGGRVFILAKMGEGIALVHGCWAKEFNDWTISDFGEKARWLHAGRNPDWEGLLKSLIMVF